MEKLNSTQLTVLNLDFILTLIHRIIRDIRHIRQQIKCTTISSDDQNWSASGVINVKSQKPVMAERESLALVPAKPQPAASETRASWKSQCTRHVPDAWLAGIPISAVLPTSLPRTIEIIPRRKVRKYARDLLSHELTRF